MVVALALVGACSVEKMPPIRMVHRGVPMVPKRAAVLPTECTPSEAAAAGEDPHAWCRGIEAIVASELAFHGIEIVDLAKLPARERTRNVIEVNTTTNGAVSERRQMTVTGPTYSDVDMGAPRSTRSASTRSCGCAPPASRPGRCGRSR